MISAFERSVFGSSSWLEFGLRLVHWVIAGHLAERRSFFLRLRVDRAHRSVFCGRDSGVVNYARVVLALLRVLAHGRPIRVPSSRRGCGLVSAECLVQGRHRTGAIGFPDVRTVLAGWVSGPSCALGLRGACELGRTSQVDLARDVGCLGSGRAWCIGADFGTRAAWRSVCVRRVSKLGMQGCSWWDRVNSMTATGEGA